MSRACVSVNPDRLHTAVSRDTLDSGWEGPEADKANCISLAPQCCWGLIPHTASPQAEREALCGRMLPKDTTTQPDAGFVLVGKFTVHLENTVTALVVTEMED